MANEEQVAILRQDVRTWNQWRAENLDARPDLTHADLSNAGLKDADLTRANLHNADLRDADLTRANLTRANLRGANLGGADLTRADLIGVILSSADLSGANFRGANLSRADLSVANLSRARLNLADFGDAVLGYTVFADVDLSEAKGLETVQHRGPSTIGIDTIYKSKGQIPEIFLRGCGVPDIFIDYMAALTRKPFEFYSCFISYSHKDEAFATRLHDTLQGKGVRCWLDEEDAKLGVPVTRNLEQGIRLTEKFLLCCSQESLNSSWVNFEIDIALQKELQQSGQDDVWRIIPLDLDGHLFSPDYSGGGLRIRNRLAGDFTNWKTDSDKFDRQVARVMRALRIETEAA